MDLNATSMFVSAVQAGSMSAGAARIGVPLPTISRRVRQLERELGVQLLERSAKGIQLTDAGTRLYEHASRGLDVLAEGEVAVRSDQARLKGRLRISLPPAFGPWWTLLEAFQREFPDIQLSVFSTERRVDLIQDGIDVALRVGAIVHETMIARRILRYRHVLVASPELLRQLGEPKSVDDLHRFPCATWMAFPSARTLWRLGEITFEPDPFLATNDYQHLCHRAVAGDVVTELPQFMAEREFARKSLRPLLTRHPFPEQEINLLYPSHRHPSGIVRAYLDYCQQNAVEHLQQCRRDPSGKAPTSVPLRKETRVPKSRK